MSTSVAKKQSTEVARPSWMEDSTRGSEEVGTQDIVLPRLAIIQSLSPQRKKNDAKYIEGAEEGDLFNTVTGELFKEPITVIPVYYTLEWVLWKNLDEGGGFMGSYHSQQEGEEAWAKHPEKNDLELLDTSVNYVLLLKDGGVEEAVMFMSKTARQPARQWNTMIKLAGGDRFSRKYTLETVEAQNKQGFSYYNWKISQGVMLQEQDEPLYRKAEQMYEAIVAGERRVQRDEDSAARENAARTDI